MNVDLNPTQTPIPGEIIEGGIVSEGARVDIRARGFWRNGQNAYFDVRVTNPLAQSAVKLPLSKIYDNHEKEKKRSYNNRIMSYDNGTFTPLIYSVFGSMGPECSVYFKTICNKISSKNNEKYNDVANWIRCKLSFLCIKSCLMCLRGTRSTGVNSKYVSHDFGYDISELNISQFLRF